MNIEEAKWLQRHLALIPDQDLFPLLNVGSSTLEFRTTTQPHIEQYVLAPLRARGGRVVHLDVKPDNGVDIVGDILNPDVRDELRRVGFRAALVSNVLEHVEDHKKFCDAVLSLIPTGGTLIVSGPHDYPYHADPIDNLFRPTIAELHACFPGTIVTDSAIIDSGNWRQWNASERGRPLGRTLLRLMLPFYRPQKWWELARQAPYIIKHITAFGVILRKEPAAAGVAPPA